MHATSSRSTARNYSPWAPFFVGALVGTLGGMIGLGGAEFRLPLLIALFGFAALEAIIRLHAVPLAEMIQHWSVVVNLLAGSLLGAWIGASVATKLAARRLYQVISVLLLLIALVLLLEHGGQASASPLLAGPAQIVVGVIAGLAIGVVASLLGVAGGEFLIPTLILVFGIDIKVAGSLSLAVSLPTMIVGFAFIAEIKDFPSWVSARCLFF